ncbi:phospho-sugar mutase [Salibacterium qingdaonense]|uniref:Phosphoglucomutase n=1 Tax=Salibacterium qingdaonense TaxID=266892 RepID=A0A1I4JAV9_9BACI|nr:phospho-sugar mutase [Salibacterium qingdaonense]SFL63256.1 alpha-phosphoglucomutase [Salibacterium qingdaonense]
MDWKENWKRWSEASGLDKDLKEQLELLEGNEEKLEDHFYKYLEFGTGGMRGEIGPGTNRMNRYTIRRAAEGLARYIEEHGTEAQEAGVVIAFDSRHRSPEFALEAALTLGAHNIQVYIFQELRPTPELSYAVRHLEAFAGIVVTASHNPPEYNGFKVYGEDGGQMPPGPAEALMAKVESVENEFTVETADENKMKASRLLKVIGEDMDHAYNDDLQTIMLHPDMVQKEGGQLSIVFTPLHGTANIPVTRLLETSGFTNVHVVQEQALPDPEFSTVKSPNPEEEEAFDAARAAGEKEGADILIATDPDADRIGIAARSEDGKYELLSGNQTGALMLEYLLSERQRLGLLPDNGIVMKTIVTSELGRAVAEDYGQTVLDTLTGFKFIGEKIKQFEKDGTYSFQFGYEESYGYLISSVVRDKDAVQAALTVSEMALWHKNEGRTLHDALRNLYETYGYYKEDLDSMTLKGVEGIERIEALLKKFREMPPTSLGSKKITVIEDYETQERTMVQNGHKENIELPVSNVLKYVLEDGSWCCIRPSGTEPKVKFYFGVCKETEHEAIEALHHLKNDMSKMVHEHV